MGADVYCGRAVTAVSVLVLSPVADGTPRNVQPGLGPPKPAAQRTPHVTSPGNLLLPRGGASPGGQLSVQLLINRQHQQQQQQGAGLLGDNHQHSNGMLLQQQPSQPVPQGQALPSPAAAAAAPAGRAVVGAPVTTPGVVKTKAGRRGAIGPLLSRLRAEQEQQGGAAAGE